MIWFSLSMMFILLLSLPCAAQNESGKRFLSDEMTKRKSIWYDSTLLETRDYEKYPIIRRIPPLSSGMPCEVMAAYIYLDSLARFYDNLDIMNGVAHLVAHPEILKKVVSCDYRATDYNPALFKQYDIETALNSDIFKWFIGSFTEPLPKAISQVAANPKEANALTSTILPDYVLRVKVVAIDSIPLAKPLAISGSRGGTHSYTVMVEVLDTLKGRVFLSCMEQSSSNSVPALPAPNFPCTKFRYYNSAYFQDISGWEFVEDSAFLADNGKFSMHVGQEAIVFLEYFGRRYSYTHDYIGLTTSPRSSYNALPIIDGKVRDVNHIWSDQLMMDYNAWRNRFMELRTKILTGTY